MSHYLGSASIDRLNKLYASCKLAQPSASIRCLTIAKGAGHGRLRAQLNVYHFAPGKSQVPPYYAISYTWGDPNGKLPLLINGIRLWISANAHKALMDVRSEHEDRVVWIDALCIDQDNETERNAQVAVMRKIYSHATDIIIWLGEPSEDSDIALDFLDEYAVHQSDYQWLERAYADPARDPSWEAIRRIFERPYWERVWVLQECSVKSNPTVQIGRRKQSFTSLTNLISLVTKPPRPPLLSKAMEVGDCLPVAIMLPSATSRSSEPLKFLNILAMGRYQQCSIPHDRVYGLLGIHPTQHQFSMPIAYDKTAEQVYVEATVSLIRQTQSLDVLGHCEPSNTKRDLPSWVPDWHTHRRQGAVAPVHSSHRLKRYCASGDLAASFIYDPTGRILEVQGYVTDSIKSCSQAYRPPRRQISFGSSVSEDPSLHDLEDTMQSWLQEITSKEPGGLLRGSTHGEKALMSTLEQEPQTEVSLELGTNSQEPELAERLAEIHARSYNRRLFKSLNNGFLGSAPDNAQQGDLVCVIRGCQVPIILRRKPDGLHHEVVGEAFVQGLMFGEGPYMGGGEQRFKLK